jgi:YaiO family outer membrane protein
MKFFSSFSTIVLVFFSVQISFSQESLNLDQTFQKAREQAFSKNYKEARKLCHEILAKNDDYLDARILLARTFSWDNKFDSARFHLRMALSQNPYNVDANLAMADVEMWDQNCGKAVEVCNAALSKIPNNYDLFIKKIKACLCLEDVECSRSTIDSLLKVYPLNIEVQELLNRTNQGNFKNRIVLEHTFEYFEKPYLRKWHVTSFQYQRSEKWGSAIAKVNVGQLVPASEKLYDPGAIQYEIDLYPNLGRGFYAYLNYGYSDGELFPNHRAGFELFKTFAKGTEASLGTRYLYFKDGSDVWIYTGSISQYIHSWWLSFRPYFSYRNEDWTQSYFLFARKYSTQYNYLGGMLGYGVSPDIIPGSLTYEVYNSNSYQVRFDFQRRLSNHFLLRTLIGYGYDEYTSGSYRHRFNAQAYFAYMF